MGSARRPLRPRWAALLLVLCAAPSSASAQEAGFFDVGFFDRLAESILASSAPRWEGPRVPWPAPSERPESRGALVSTLRPVAVHAAGLRADAELVQGALVALERAHAWLEARRWPTPPPDGGLGGTAGFDLYLVDELAHDLAALDEGGAPGPVYVREGYDTPNAWSGLDGAIAHARMVAELDPIRLEACVTSAYVRAALLGFDPSEAPAWRAATGDYVAWLVTGRFGCSDEALVRQQRASARTWIGDDPEGGGGALLLAMLSARTDGLSGRFIRDLWSGAPQVTWEGEGLRAMPDLWQVLHVLMDAGRDPLPGLIEELAVARYFAGEPARLRGAPLALLRELPRDAQVPIAARVPWARLPRRFDPEGLELEPHGSAYLLVDTAEAPPGSALRIWLRGEAGVGWALTAVRLGADGRERGRVRAPVRPENPHSYIPLELLGGETASVLLVVTNIGRRLVDADGPNDEVRSFGVILDKLEP